MRLRSKCGRYNFDPVMVDEIQFDPSGLMHYQCYYRTRSNIDVDYNRIREVTDWDVELDGGIVIGAWLSSLTLNFEGGDPVPVWRLGEAQPYHYFSTPRELHIRFTISTANRQREVESRETCIDDGYQEELKLMKELVSMKPIKLEEVEEPYESSDHSYLDTDSDL